MREPLVFLGVIALLTITPGADMAMVARSVFMGGRRAAFATTLGHQRRAAWSGRSRPPRGSPRCWRPPRRRTTRCGSWAPPISSGSASQSLLAARRGYSASETVQGTAGRGPSPFRQGLLTNLFNPKIALFYTTFLPQFIGPGDPVILLSLAMASVHILLGLVWLSAYAWLLDRAVEAFRGSRVRRALDALTGAVLVGSGSASQRTSRR